MKRDISSVVATRRAPLFILIPALKRRAKLISTLRVEKAAPISTSAQRSRDQSRTHRSRIDCGGLGGSPWQSRKTRKNLPRPDRSRRTARAGGDRRLRFHVS